MEKVFIVYKATSKTSGKSYIGQTRKGLKARKSSHFSAARMGGSCPHFHSAIRKYGEEDFHWVVLGVAHTQKDVLELEIEFISKFKTFGRGYNMTPGGEGVEGVFGRYTASQETRERQSESAKKSPRAKKHLKNLHEAQKGVPLSKNTREKISKAHKSNKEFMLHVKELGKSNKGKSPSDQTRKKMGDARRGVPRTPETRKRISESHKHNQKLQAQLKRVHETLRGVPLSEQTRNKLRDANCMIIVTPFGTFKGSKEAAKHVNVCRETVSRRCRSEKPKWKTWFYLTKEEGQ